MQSYFYVAREMRENQLSIQSHHRRAHVVIQAEPGAARLKRLQYVERLLALARGHGSPTDLCNLEDESMFWQGYSEGSEEGPV